MSSTPPEQPPDTAARSTLLGLGAVLLWASLAGLTALAGPIPPFQLSAMTFTIGALVGVAWAAVRREPFGVLLSVPAAAYLLGMYGLLLFHVCYFHALQRAPVIEASLVIYLWPLLIVLLSGLLPAALGGKGLGWRHIAGAALGLAGTAQILLGGGESLAFAGHADGYLAALAAAFIWASYSVASRLLAAVSSTAVIGSCALTALGGALLHLALERTVWPVTPGAWLAIVGLGLGPVGLAFYLWDEGMKRGSIRLLGVASYATPLLSTVLLGALGLGQPTPRLWFAAVLITAGALLAGSDLIIGKGASDAHRS